LVAILNADPRELLGVTAVVVGETPVRADPEEFTNHLKADGVWRHARTMVAPDRQAVEERCGAG
jgi:hypothetical protein